MHWHDADRDAQHVRVQRWLCYPPKQQGWNDLFHRTLLLDQRIRDVHTISAHRER